MSRYTPEQINERYQKLPQALKDALLSVDAASIMWELGKKHKLTIEDTGKLAEEAGYVIFGLTKPENFVGIIAEQLGLADEKASTIAQEINQKIFLPLREALKRAHNIDIGIGGKGQVARETPRPAPPTPRRKEELVPPPPRPRPAPVDLRQAPKPPPTPPRSTVPPPLPPKPPAPKPPTPRPFRTVPLKAGQDLLSGKGAGPMPPAPPPPPKPRPLPEELSEKQELDETAWREKTAVKPTQLPRPSQTPPQPKPPPPPPKPRYAGGGDPYREAVE